ALPIFYADYRVANEILDRHQYISRQQNRVANGIKFTYLMGNHEDRVRKFMEANPQTKGLLDVSVNLRLRERGFKLVECYPKGEVHKIGKAHFIHGIYTGGNHAKRTVDAFGVNVFYGHTHDVQSSSKVLWGSDSTIVGQSLGCLCRYDLDYVGSNP